MKIAVLCHSDINGGAAVATTRLVNALSLRGADAQMIVLRKDGTNLRVEEAGGYFEKKIAFYAERAGIFFRNGFRRDTLFKVSTASHGISITENPTIQEADAIILSWINQGILSLAELKRLIKTGKPIIWVMHDMWCFTGICHHAYGCRNYTEQCGACKFLRNKPNDMSHTIWEKKRKLYNSSNIHFVAVSSWLRDRAVESSLLHDKLVHIIPNAFPIDDYPLQQHIAKRNKIIMVAARLDDTVKGLDYAIEALNIFNDKCANLAHGMEALFVGAIRDTSKLDALRFPHRHVGTVSDSHRLRELYSESAIVLSSSLYETFGMTLIEGQACGAIPVSFAEGGQADIIDDGKTGFIANYKDSESLADCIAKALSNLSITTETLHASVARRFSADTVAREYIDLLGRMK